MKAARTAAHFTHFFHCCFLWQSLQLSTRFLKHWRSYINVCIVQIIGTVLYSSNIGFVFFVLCHSIKCGCIRAFTHLMIIKVMAQAWPVSHSPSVTFLYYLLLLLSSQYCCKVLGYIQIVGNLQVFISSCLSQANTWEQRICFMLYRVSVVLILSNTCPT